MVVDERDLDIIMQNKCKVSKQCDMVVSRVNRVLGTFYWRLKYKSKDVILRLCKSLVYSHFEY